MPLPSFTRLPTSTIDIDATGPLCQGRHTCSGPRNSAQSHQRLGKLPAVGQMLTSRYEEFLARGLGFGKDSFLPSDSVSPCGVHMSCKQVKIDVATGTLMVGTCLVDTANANMYTSAQPFEN
jgi:hypothetical protein